MSAFALGEMQIDGCRRMGQVAVLIVLVGLLLGCGQNPPTPAPPPTVTSTPAAAPTAGLIVAMGDSLTEGLGVSMEEAYPAQLERKLRTDGYNYTVINAGVSGETTTGALARIDWVLTLQPDLVILATGGNDSLRAIDPALTKENIRKVVQAFQGANVPVILAGMQTVQNLGEEYTTTFRAIFPAVAEEYQIPLIPFFLEGVAGDPKLNQPDFIHPTAEGYTVVVETIYPYVMAALERLEP